MKENISIRLKRIMNDRNLKQVDILELARPYCERLDVKLTKSDLSQYISGKVEPGSKKISILGMALNINEAWLMGYDVSMERKDVGQIISNIYPIELKKFPLLGEVSCGVPKFANEDRESYIMAGTEIKADFCLIAKGDSMINARINDGDIIFIRKQDTVENGEIAAVVVNDDNEALLKRFYYYSDKGLLILKPENPAYEDMIYSGEELNHIHVLGKAIAFQSDIK